MCDTEIHKNDAKLFRDKNKILQQQLHDQKDAFDIRQKSRLRELQLLQARAVVMKDSRLKDMKSLVRDKSNHLVQLEHENKSNAKRASVNQTLLGVTYLSHTKLRKHGDEHQQRAKMWKERFDKLSQQLVDEKYDSEELSDQLEEWRRIAEEMQGKYERQLKSIMPLKISKVWVKNVGTENGQKKRGKSSLLKYWVTPVTQGSTCNRNASSYTWNLTIQATRQLSSSKSKTSKDETTSCTNHTIN